MEAVAAVDAVQAGAALEAVVPRLTGLIRSVGDPAASAVGEWSAADVALHLSHAFRILPALAAGEMESPLDDLSRLGALTASMVEAEHGASMDEVAGRIEESAATFLRFLGSAPGPGDGAGAPWLLRGVTAPLSTFACHLLSESLVHGDDLARSQDRRWTIEPAHAALALSGFVFPVLAAVDPRALVDQKGAAGLRACYDLRVRGGGRVFVVLDDGTACIEAPSSRPVDCHISAQPATLLLVLFSRRGQWPALFSGRLRAWGRKPWLAHRLRTAMRNP